jgi:DNA-binding NarL/FixJ family response regulator
MSQFIQNRTLTIILADDHDVVRAGIKRLLSIDKTLQVIDEAANGENAVELVNYHKPDIALIDINMPKMNGIVATEMIKEANLDTCVVILTAYDDSSHMEKALQAGADGYLIKDIGSKDLIDSMHRVVMGERVFSKSVLSILQSKHWSSSDDDNQVVITKREQEILNNVALGKTSIEIADLLNISTRTVESHRYNLMKKLSVKNTAELVRFAVMNTSLLA